MARTAVSRIAVRLSAEELRLLDRCIQYALHIPEDEPYSSYEVRAGYLLSEKLREALDKVNQA